MEINKSEALTKDDILETMRTLNAINSAVMVGAHVAIEKFMARKNISKHHRKFFINEIAKSLVQNPQIKQQVVEIQRGGFVDILKKITKNKGKSTPASAFIPVTTSSPEISSKIDKTTTYSANTFKGSAPTPAPDNIPVAEVVKDETIPTAQLVSSPPTQNNVNGDESDESFQSTMESALIESMMDNYSIISKGVFKKIVQVSSNIFEKLINLATGGILYKSPEELTSETNKIILVLSMVLKDLSTDEKQIQAMKDISEAFTKTMLDVMDVILPSVKMMVSKTFDNISTIGAQSASGGMKVFISTAKAAISEVPILGGIINLILAFGEAFNVFSKILSTLTTSGSNMSKDFVDAYIKARNKFEESFTRHKLEIEELRTLRDSSIPIANTNINQLQAISVPTLQMQTNNQISGVLPKIIPQPQKPGMLSRMNPLRLMRKNKTQKGGKKMYNYKKYKLKTLKIKKQRINKVDKYKYKKKKTIKRKRNNKHNNLKIHRKTKNKLNAI
jgi:hypothetical protein